MGGLIKKLTPKEDSVMQCQIHGGCITTNLEFKIYFTFPELSATDIMMWNFRVDDSSKSRYDMILGRDILTALGLNLKFFYHFIESYYGNFKGFT